MKFSNQPITLDAFRAINATHAAPQMSKQYSFIPTTTALEVLRDHGWYPTSAREMAARSEDKIGFQTHTIRLQNEALTQQIRVGTTIPQISLRNAHGGSSAFVLDLALLELRCLNGLMVNLGGGEQKRILHRNFDPTSFEATLDDLVGHFDEVMTAVDRWRGLRIKEAHARAFAEAAIELRWDGEKYSVDRDLLLLPARNEERERTLWNTYQTVQEKVLKGGVDVLKKEGAKPSRRSRPIQNQAVDVRLNKALWTLAAALENAV